MERRAVVGVGGVLLHKLLDAVLAAGVHPGGDGLFDARGVVHLAGGHEQHPPALCGGLYPRAHGGDVFGYGHAIYLPSKFSAGKRISSLLRAAPAWPGGDGPDPLTLAGGPGGRRGRDKPRGRGRGARYVAGASAPSRARGRTGAMVEMACL